MNLDRLETEVTETETVQQSAVTLLTGLAQQLRDANTKGTEAVTALADRLDASSNALAEAITANTPAAPGTDGTEPVDRVN